MKILLIEDSELLRRSLVVGLGNLGFTVDDSDNGETGFNMARHNHYDIIILDLMLPQMDGMSILEKLRKENVMTRVLILSARNEAKDRVSGLLKGADDYLTKPFSFEELHARILTIMRRGQVEKANDNLCVGDFTLNLTDRTFYYKDQLITLTPNEYKILECLFNQPNRVVSLEKISNSVVGNFDFLSRNSIEVHMSSIRRKVRALNSTLPVKTKRGFGYIAQS